MTPGEIWKARRRRWKDACLEIVANWHDKDTDALREVDSFEDHVAYVLSDVRRKNEVNIKQRVAAERKEFDVAKKLEATSGSAMRCFRCQKSRCTEEQGHGHATDPDLEET